MKPLAHLAAAAIAFAAFSAPALSQQQQPPQQQSPDSTVTVTGTRNMERQVREFVSALTPAPAYGNIARLETTVCPRVLGAAGAQNALIEQRLRTIAAAVGLEVAPEGCRPNAVMVITRDKRAFIQALWRRNGNHFGNSIQPMQVSRLARQGGPTAFWRLEGNLSAGGTVAEEVDPSSSLDLSQTTGRASRITTGMRKAFDAAVLVVEARALDGLTTTQLADYAAMRLYGSADPARLPAQSPSTILSLLDSRMGAEVPVTMTQWDFSFLRGLYASNETLRAPGQRGEIARQIARDLNAPPDTPR